MARPLALNVMSPVAPTKLAIPGMIVRKPGRILNGRAPEAFGAGTRRDVMSPPCAGGHGAGEDRGLDQ